MKTIFIASTNPVKIEATLRGFQAMFPEQKFVTKSVQVPSEVGSQPFSNGETLEGAINRAKNAKKVAPDGDFWVGIEGGVAENNGSLAAFAWIVIQAHDLTGQSRTGTFFLPVPIARLLREGKELGEADDIVFHQTNSKQVQGAIGLLTRNVINRRLLYQHAVILALVPFKNRQLYLT